MFNLETVIVVNGVNKRKKLKPRAEGKPGSFHEFSRSANFPQSIMARAGGGVIRGEVQDSESFMFPSEAWGQIRLFFGGNHGDALRHSSAYKRNVVRRGRRRRSTRKGIWRRSGPLKESFFPGNYFSTFPPQRRAPSFSFEWWSP